MKSLSVVQIMKSLSCRSVLDKYVEQPISELQVQQIL
jgi:hypothetical protein